MSRLIVVAAFCAGLTAIPSVPACAQSAATDEDLTVRPGDRIEWSGRGPHRVQFGGTVGAVALTPLSDVDKVLTVSPALMIEEHTGTGTSAVGGSPMLTATVKYDAGVPSFTFTCGRHPGDMLSLPFKIAPANGQPPRTLKIKAVGLDWMLEKAGGDVKVDRR